MDNKQMGIIAVAVVAVLLVAGAGVMLMNNGDNNSGSETKKYVAPELGCSLWVYGNANGDDKIDNADVELLEKIVAGTASEVKITIYDGYNAWGTPYAYISLADADGDGSVTAKDVQKVKDIIEFQTNYAKAVKEGTLDAFCASNEITVYYENCDMQKVSITLPINKFGVVYFTNGEVVRLLGATDRVVLADNTIIDNHKTMLPEYQAAGIVNVGNTRFALDPDTLIKAHDVNGMTAVFTGSASTYSPELEKKVGTKVDVIRLPAWEDNNFMAGTLTLGYLLGTTEKAYEYIDWAKGVIDSVASALKGVNLTDIICAKGRTNAIMAGNGNGSGRSEITQWAGANNLVTTITPVSSEYPDIKTEWALKANPKCLVLSGNGVGYEKTAEEATKTMKGVYDACKENTAYGGTDAAKNGKILIVSDDILTGPSAVCGLVYIACYLHADQMSAANINADVIFQQYEDKFGLGSSYKVTDHIKQFIYDGTA